jgi:prepilin signal peptidase PulO-like enzyme (type II secretory pathway)
LFEPRSLAAVSVFAVAFTVPAFARFHGTPAAWALTPLFVVLGAIAVLDLRRRLIPDVLSLPALAYGLVATVTLGRLTLAESALGVAGAGGIALLFAIVSRGALGGGDIKLMAALGAALGWQPALIAFGLSQLTAAVILLVVSLVRRQLVRDAFPIGALLALLGAGMLVYAP